jgi:hypothetical protein
LYRRSYDHGQKSVNHGVAAADAVTPREAGQIYATRDLPAGLTSLLEKGCARPPSRAGNVGSASHLLRTCFVLSNRDPVGPALRAPKTAELIASYIRGQVVRGELKTGDSLPPETALMEMFGVSRPTLHEAFRILEAESLISVRRGARGGARVVSPDIAVAARYVGLLFG